MEEEGQALSYQQTSPHAHTPAFPRIKTYPLSVGSFSTESPIWGSGTDRARRTADLLLVSAIGAVLVEHGAKTWAAKRKGGGGKPPVSSPPNSIPPIPFYPITAPVDLRGSHTIEQKS